MIDGSYLLHRSMHLPGAESGPNGYPVGAIMKCLQSLTSMVRLLGPARVFWVHDAGHHPQRLALYPEYKEKRYKDDEKREEAEKYREMYHMQRDLLLAWLPHFGVHVINGPYESDDSIWYLTNVMTQYGVPSVICTEDHDFSQLLSEKVWVYAPHKEIMVTRDSWAEWTKWPPDQIIMAKAILGDASDNIVSPCKGLGPTGLKKLFHEATDFTIEALAHIVEQKFHKAAKYQSLLDPEVHKQIERNRKLIDLSAGLTFTDEFERNVVWSECCRVAQHNMQLVMGFMAQYEMNNLLRIYGLWQPHFERLT